MLRSGATRSSIYGRRPKSIVVADHAGFGRQPFGNSPFGGSS